MSEKNEAMARRMIEEVWNNRKIDALETFYAPDVVRHDPQAAATGLDAVREVVKRYQTAFPDVRLHVDEVLSTGDRVIMRWRATGTHRAALENIPASGRQATVSGITIARISGDRVREEFVNWDALGLMQQLGVVTLPGRATAAGA